MQVRKAVFAKVNRFSRVLDKHIFSSRRISSVYEVVSGAYYKLRNTRDNGTMIGGPLSNNAAVTVTAGSITTTNATSAKSEIKKFSELPSRDLSAFPPVHGKANLKYATKWPLTDFTGQLGKDNLKVERVGRLKPEILLNGREKPTNLLTESTVSVVSTAGTTKISSSTMANNKDSQSCYDKSNPPMSTAVTKTLADISDICSIAPPTVRIKNITASRQPTVVSCDDTRAGHENKSDSEDSKLKFQITQTQTNTSVDSNDIPIIDKNIFSNENGNTVNHKKRHKMHYGRRLKKRIKAAAMASNSNISDYTAELHASSNNNDNIVADRKSLDSRNVKYDNLNCLSIQNLNDDLETNGAKPA